MIILKIPDGMGGQNDPGRDRLVATLIRITPLPIAIRKELLESYESSWWKCAATS